MFDKKPGIRRFTFPWNVFRIIPDEVSGWIGVECRNDSTRDMGIGFVLSDAREGDVNLFQPENGWYSGLDEFYNYHFLIYEYDDHSLPMMSFAHLYRVDEPGGEPEPVNVSSGTGYLGICDRGLFRSAGEREGGFELVNWDGQKVLEIWKQESREEVLALMNSFIEKQRMVHRKYPHRAIEGEEKFASLKDELGGRFMPFGQLEYLEVGDWLARVFFVRTEAGKLDQWFQLLQGGEILIEERLQSETEKMTLETFFWFQGKLVLLAGKREVWLVG